MDDHDILHCNAFKDLEVTARMDVVRKQSVCFCCLKIGHVANKCFFKTMCTEKDQTNRVCGSTRHKLLHNDLSRTETMQNMAENKECHGKGGVILMISEVYSIKTPFTTLWDTGANLSLISKEAVMKLGLKGQPVTLSITKIGNNIDELMSMEYKLPLTDEGGTTWFMTVYELPEITAEVGKIDLSEVAKLF